MAILPNTKNFNNLILTGHDYIRTEGGLGSNTQLQKLYLKRADSSLINPNTPLLAPITGLSFHFNLKTILNNKSLFVNDTLPTVGEKGIWRTKGLTEHIFVTVNDAITEEIDVIHASLPERIFYQFEQTYFSNLDKFNSPFLSIAPILKKTKSTTPQYLYYLNNLNPMPSELRLWATVITDDVIHRINIANFTQPIPNAIYGCTVGLTDIIKGQNIDINAVTRYAVYLSGPDDKAITELRTYIIDDSFQEDTQVLLFRNNFNVFDTLEFTGTYSSSNDYEHSSFKTENTVIDYNTEITQKLTFRTGALEQNWLQYIADVLMNSNEIYHLRPDGSRVRLSKLTKTLKTRDEKSITDTAEIEFRIAKN
jgi:hypothetical protein